MDGAIAAYLDLSPTKNIRILKWLDYCNQLEKRLDKFTCPMCTHYHSLRQSRSDVNRQAVQLVDDMTMLVAFIRDVVSHWPGQEFSSYTQTLHHFGDESSCSCWDRLENDLDKMLKTVMDFLRSYKRADCILDLDDPFYAETDYRSFASERLAQRIQETYKNVQDHILFISQAVRQCWQSHPFMAKYGAYRWKGCDPCVVAAKTQS